eukprot:m.378883 g.378883  ORF g.378883 m.378883 type:complete len:140 (-) comp56208_c0_seq1:124-543(-)
MYGRSGSRWDALYQASVHGFTTADFLSAVGGRRPTITLIKTSSGYLIGGVTDQPWNSHESCRSSSGKTFLFRLESPTGEPPAKFPLLKRNFATRRAAGACMIFGGAEEGQYDLFISDNCNQSAGFVFSCILALRLIFLD